MTGGAGREGRGRKREIKEEEEKQRWQEEQEEKEEGKEVVRAAVSLLRQYKKTDTAEVCLIYSFSLFSC